MGSAALPPRVSSCRRRKSHLCSARSGIPESLGQVQLPGAATRTYAGGPCTTFWVLCCCMYPPHHSPPRKESMHLTGACRLRGSSFLWPCLFEYRTISESALPFKSSAIERIASRIHRRNAPICHPILDLLRRSVVCIVQIYSDLQPILSFLLNRVALPLPRCHFFPYCFDVFVH